MIAILPCQFFVLPRFWSKGDNLPLAQHCVSIVASVKWVKIQNDFILQKFEFDLNCNWYSGGRSLKSVESIWRLRQIGGLADGGILWRQSWRLDSTPLKPKLNAMSAKIEQWTSREFWLGKTLWCDENVMNCYKARHWECSHAQYGKMTKVAEWRHKWAEGGLGWAVQLIK